MKQALECPGDPRPQFPGALNVAQQSVQWVNSKQVSEVGSNTHLAGIRYVTWLFAALEGHNAHSLTGAVHMKQRRDQK